MKLDIKDTIFTHADLLAERHADYVYEFVTRANDELYAILAELLALYEKIESLLDKEKMIKQMRKKLREEYKIKTQANTKISSLVVRYVTRSSRKTAHVYGRVLEVAIFEGVSSANLVEYIKAKGGIDRVRKAVDNAETKQMHKKREKLLHEKLTRQLQQNPTLGNVQFNQVTSTNLPHASDVVFMHLLCTFNHRSNQHEIVSVLYPNSALEAQALGTHLTLLEVASHSNNDVKFQQLCKERGLNMDITHRWMKSNNTPSANDALNIVQAIKNTKLGKTDSRPVVLKLAA